MLRVILAIDDSGSMGTCLHEVQMAQMLLNKSLHSLRVNFKERMRETLGDYYTDDIDLVTDVQIWSFGHETRLIKDFEVQDLSFLDDQTARRPEVNINREMMASLRAFKEIRAGGRETKDGDFWKAVYDQHFKNSKSADWARLLKENKLTEFICELTDGAIDASDKSGRMSPLYREGLKKLGVMILGFAIGGEGVKAALEKHLEEEVIEANTPQMIVDKFGEALKKAIQAKLEQPMMDLLDGAEDLARKKLLSQKR